MNEFQKKLMLQFSCMWAFVALGVVIGMLTPIELLTPALIAILLLHPLFMRKPTLLQAALNSVMLTTIIIGKMTGVVLPGMILLLGTLTTAITYMSLTILTPLLYAIPLSLGMTISWSIQFQADTLDKTNILGATLIDEYFIVTICIFILIGLSGVFLPNVSGWGVYLFGAVVVTVAIGLLFIFLPGSDLVLFLIIWVSLIALVFCTIFIFIITARKHIEGS